MLNRQIFLRTFYALLTVFLLNLSTTAAQDVNALPPHVIDVQPAPGVELGSDEPLTIYFDQPMKPDAVSVDFAPMLTGTMTWIDSRTLVFVPEDETWPINQHYAVTISGTATNGLELDPAHKFEMQGPSGLRVAAVTPEDAAEGVDPAGTQISVTFDRPVVPLVSTVDQDSLPSPLTFSPEIDGDGEWVNTSAYMFTPATPRTPGKAHLAGNTRYMVTVKAGLTAVDGTTLTEDFSWTFRTLAPQVINVNATEVFDEDHILLDSGFQIEFSQPMDREATEAAFRFSERQFSPTNYEEGPEIPGSFLWDDESLLLTFQPDERLNLSSDYWLTLEETARSANGAAVLMEPLEQEFDTVGTPFARRTYPRASDSVRPGRGRVQFEFNTAMNFETFADRYTVSPEPDGEITPYTYDQRYFSLEFQHEDDTTYTVTLLAGMEDIYGNATENDHSASYTVRAYDPPVESSARPRLNYDFSLANDANDETLLPMIVEGSPEVTISIYRTDLDTVRSLNYNWSQLGYWGYRYQSLYDMRDAAGGSHPFTPPWVADDNLLSTWTEQYVDQARDTTVYIPLALENGDPLPVGIYGIEMLLPSSYRRTQEKSGFVLAVTNAAITIKKTTTETLAWVTDINSAEPIPNVNIDIWHGSGDSVAHGQTDADGVFQLPENQSQTYVLAEGNGVFGVWYENASPAATQTASYLYTDRPIYRPGETVYFRGVLRAKDDVTYTVPPVRIIGAKARFGYGYSYYGDDTEAPIYEAELAVNNDFGTFSGSFEIPEAAHLGQYYLQVGSVCDPYTTVVGLTCQAMGDSLNFEVADFRVPEYEVKVTAQQPEIIQGEPLNALVEANYYFGAPVNDANLIWNVKGSGYYAAYFRYAGPERGFRFQESGYSYTIENQAFPGRQTDAQGRHLFAGTVTLPSFRPVNVIVEATVSDESQQPISARTNILVHPAAVYVGLRSAQMFNTLDLPVSLDVLTVTPDSVVQPNQSVDLEIVETRWTRTTISFGRYDWENEEIPVATATVKTDANGKGSYEFTAPNTGIFRVRAITFDTQGRENRSEIGVYVRDNTPQRSRQLWGDPFEYYETCGYSPEVRQLKLVVDQESYRPGDVAEILIPNPYDGPVTALITVERQYIMHREVQQITDDSLIYRLALTDDHAPTAYLNVLLMHGSSVDDPNPDTVRGQVRLNVEPVNRRLTVELDPSSMEVAPGKDVSFDVRLTDSHGDPVVGEVGLALTDEAVLALRPANSGLLETAFYYTQPLRVETSVGLRALLSVPNNTSEVGCGGGGGGEGLTEPNIREDFEYTPLWTPHVVTDADGRATVSVEMPDNLTRWRLDARAVTADTLVGQNEINIVSTLPLMVRPAAPRFFVVGDQLPLAAIINNNTDEPQIVTARIEASGVNLESGADITDLEIPPGGRVRVEWPATVLDVEGVDFTVFVSSESGLQDAAKPTLRTGPDGTIPVFHYTAPDTVATGGMLLEADTHVEGISLPPRFADVDGILTVQLDPSIAATAIDSLDYLRNFPHQCIEQTVSRFYPNAVTYNALRSLNLDDPQLAENLQTALNQGYTILLNGQNQDGGWGWFTNMESNAYVTAYALLGLHEAKQAGYEVDQELVAKALTYMRRQIRTSNLHTEAWELNRKAFLVYVLSLYSESYQLQLDDLYEYRLKMSLAARAYLLMAYHEVAPDDEAVAALTSDLTTAAILSANGAHWEEAETDWHNWGSDTRTTSLALLALGRVQPDQPLLPNIVRWLMIARRGDRWQTTQETAWAVIALTEWMVNTGELQGNYGFTVQMNADELVNRDVTPETVRTGETIQIEVNDLLRDEINRLTIDREAGPGALYYSALLQLQLPADQVEAISRGVSVERDYYIGTDRGAVEAAQVGDTVTVRMTINLPQDVYYFTLEDALPAGLEAIDSNLLTASQAGDDPELERLDTEDQYWYWRWWFFDRTELRDEGAVLYADYLPRGTYVYTYQARATTPGVFQTLPAQGYAFYQPDVFGRTDGTTFTVEP